MIASPLSQLNISPLILQRQMRLYVPRLIAKAKKSPTFSNSTKEMVLNFLDKSKILGDTERYVQLLEYFANDLQKSTHMGMLDQHLERALANPELSNKQRVNFSSVRVLLLIQRGQLTLAQEVLDAAWAAANTPLLQAVLYNRKGVLLEVRGEYHASYQRYEQALLLAQEEDDLALISGIYNNFGNWAYVQDRYQEALTYYTNGLQVAKVLDGSRHSAPLEGGLAMTLDELGQYEEANYYHWAARRHYEEAGHLIGVVRCDLNLSYHALEQGKPVEAKEFVSRALKLAQELGDLHRVATAWHHLGRVYYMEGTYALAIECLLKALQRRHWLEGPLYIQNTEKELKKLLATIEADQKLAPTLKKELLGQIFNALEQTT